VASSSYHTLTIPRKGRYRLVLSDGTIVWLNAASSIRFPAQFPATERKVYVTGETYFEVAKDARKPFRVVTGNVEVEAVGTAFNVNAYPEEPAIATSLIEGQVLVRSGATENLLQPGQQALVNATGFSIVPASLKEVAGWKNDEFVFVNTPLSVLLRQVQRWYDAEVQFKEPVEVHLNARISRSVPLSSLLRILEGTGHVHFEVKGQTIYVSK
jgi:transmembrane sensor